MDVDAAGGVGESSLVTKLPHQLLDVGNVLIGADRADQLGFVGSVGGHFLTVFFLLRDDAPVVGEFPLPARGIRGNVCLIVCPNVPALPARKLAAA